MAKELFCSFNYDDQCVKLQGRQINIGEEGITKVFKLPCKGLMAGAWEGYNDVATIILQVCSKNIMLCPSRREGKSREIISINKNLDISLRQHVRP
jgi:hypothetical protein